MTAPGVLCIRFENGPGTAAAADRAALLALLHEITPVVQALPDGAVLADVRGAARYFGRDAVQLARLLRVRILARYGTETTIGVAANPLLARMAAQAGPPGGVRALPGDPAAVTGFLAEKNPRELPGVGAATARTLAHYGLDTLGRIAVAPPGTLQRILGVREARRIQRLARGVDPAPVIAAAPPRSALAEHTFPRDELDPAARRRALLHLADRLGHRLRREGRVARTLTLTVRYADRATTTRARTLPEPTAHTLALVRAAYRLHDGLGLQRARVRVLALRAGDLADARQATRQLSLDPADERRHRAEAAADRVRHRFGPAAATPAAATRPPSGRGGVGRGG